MPIIKRLVIHAQGGFGVKKCFDYITRDEKTEQKAYVSALNCSRLFAPYEFKENAMRFRKDKDDRVAYHIIQSFDPCDPITPDLAHEMGIKLCQDLYPGYQCVIATHTDRPHLHNHILLNAVNMRGYKLRDRLFDSEGIMKLHEKSDEIARKYGCIVMENAPYAGYSHKAGSICHKPSQASVLRKLIDKIKFIVNSIKELIHQLMTYGYQIRQKEHLAVKAPGSKRYMDLRTLGPKYTEEALNRFFAEKTAAKVPVISTPNIQTRSGLELTLSIKIYREYRGIQTSSLQLSSKNWYPEYYNARYKALEELNWLSSEFSMLSWMKINSVSALDQQICDHTSQLNSLYKNRENMKNVLDQEKNFIQEADIFIKNYHLWEKWNNTAQQTGKLSPTPDVASFLQAAHQIGTFDLNTVKNRLRSCRNTEKNIAYTENYIKNLQKEKEILEGFKKLATTKEPYLKNISFHESDIDQRKSKEDTAFINVPNTDINVYVYKSWLIAAPTKKEVTLFLVDDKKYPIYDKAGHRIGELTGSELHKRYLEPPAPKKEPEVSRYVGIRTRNHSIGIER